MDMFDLTNAKDGNVVAQTIDDFGIVDFIWHEEYKMIWADKVIVTRMCAPPRPAPAPKLET